MNKDTKCSTSEDAKKRLTEARFCSLRDPTVEYLTALQQGIERWLESVNHELIVTKRARIAADIAAHPDDRDGNYDIMGHYICPNFEAMVTSCDCHYCAVQSNKVQSEELA